ncbi:MAG: ethanolamine ammonia-lyase subunit EutC [Leptospiraceae bacterium]|nr:ethanolamine ammonia-lyase subunit EutC [Leptospiraceae bacterium]
MQQKENKVDKKNISDPWFKLKQFTSARIGLGRSGVGIPTKNYLDFQMAHAKAKDAVLTEINFQNIRKWLKNNKLQFIELESSCQNRESYLTRPDFGRMLSKISNERLKSKTKIHKNNKISISLVVVDGLSSIAIENNILPLFENLLPELRKKYLIPPVNLVKNGRVAIGDEISYLQKTDICIVFIGERPGLSSPDSLGIYLTYKPKIGTTDERRNCISNIRIGGLSYPLAVKKILYLLEESLRKKISGVNLKDNIKLTLN